MAGAHCPGMCGPLMLAFRLGAPRDGQETDSRWRALGRACKRVGLYQTGRGAVYALFGVVIGAIGASLALTVSRLGPWLMLAVALAFLFAACWQAGLRSWWQERHPSTSPVHEPVWIQRLTGSITRSTRSRPGLRALGLGAIMAFLPCHVPFVVMGLAATSASPVHGACLMLTVVVATTPSLVVIAALPHIIGPRNEPETCNNGSHRWP